MLNHQEIKSFNPQRYPIALIDRIVTLTPGERVVALKAVTATEACYRGIGDQAGIEALAYPPSLMTESFCQAAGPLCAQSGLDFNSKVMLFVSMAEVEYLGRAYPGDVMRHEVRIVKVLSDAVVLSGEVTVDGAVVARFGQMVVAARERGALA